MPVLKAGFHMQVVRILHHILTDKVMRKLSRQCRTMYLVFMHVAPYYNLWSTQGPTHTAETNRRTNVTLGSLSPSLQIHFMYLTTQGLLLHIEIGLDRPSQPDALSMGICPSLSIEYILKTFLR